MKNFLVHNDCVKQEMFGNIGIKSVEDLFSQIPKAARMQNSEFGTPLSELETQRKIKTLAAKNKTDFINFIGAGVYNKFVPACVAQIAQRFEFLTAYTPYQAEIAQGTLQIMYEFQTMISRLTGMDISNATVYDGATACAEALLMAVRINKKSKKVLVHKNINPEYLRVINTYMWAGDIELELFDELPQDTTDYAGVLIQTPNYYGEILNVKKSDDTLLIVCTDLSTLSLLKPPAEFGADIVVADIQTLGIPMSFGGPHAGVICCKEKYMRQMPGRLAGRTVDNEGEQAFTLTIQTREQHIKREKATSNICSNQALMGLWATVYLSVMGEKGFRQAGYLSTKQAHKLSEGLTKLGYKIPNENFFNEFVVECKDSSSYLDKLKNNNILGGVKLDDNRVLVATTEIISDDDIELYLNSL